MITFIIKCIIALYTAHLVIKMFRFSHIAIKRKNKRQSIIAITLLIIALFLYFMIMKFMILTSH